MVGQPKISSLVFSLPDPESEAFTKRNMDPAFEATHLGGQISSPTRVDRYLSSQSLHHVVYPIF